MKKNDEESGWKQHFPTYFFKDRDVALEEYRSATKALEAEERVFLNAANLSVVVAAALGSLVLGNIERVFNALSPAVPVVGIFAILIFLVYGFSSLTLRYFADRHKSVVFAARKVIVLRRMLGLSYGNFQLVLPNWRVEGADEPFSVRLFPGWNTYATYPCYAISGISSVVILFIVALIFNTDKGFLPDFSFTPFPLVIGVSITWFALLSWNYRKALLDTHETKLLLIAIQIARFFNLRLVSNFEYVIYRANLGSYELSRLEVKLTQIRNLLVQIEDKEFYSHHGTSVKGLARLILSVVGLYRRSGGSTITQQLVRTLFIVDQRKLIRRKLVEIVLARWFDGVFSKRKQLDLYLSSVRFETEIFGVVAAMNYYFGQTKKQLSPAEAFFLIERVSNVRSRLLADKIHQTLKSAENVGLLDMDAISEVIELYAQAIAEGKIKDPNGNGIIRLRQGFDLPCLKT
ncbi:MAG: biosynthetic peptidoglycan transglycosylase [Hydrogenovibrio sp.]|uniref:biosynthetic peptidoglycan transglycosylase n=1 Tax=Hydrogenovibrio sp. TaxID=2065821 RepID=UPI0028704E3D|nr:biosynthetic peptidoglycan transglycosylase [Hydrogenovibrio sp.]MDR9497746.1 biosynthetic peptidoglycan transglycosylase [Hydrogenovibrio sp.]